MSFLSWACCDYHADLLHGGTYFLQDDASKLIKIGRTKNFKSRLQGITSGFPGHLTVLAVHPDQSREAELHSQFAASRVHGEWFQPSSELLDLIKNLQWGIAIFCDHCGSVMWSDEKGHWRVKDAREGYAEFAGEEPHYRLRDNDPRGRVFCSSDCCNGGCDRCVLGVEDEEGIPELAST